MANQSLDPNEGEGNTDRLHRCLAQAQAMTALTYGNAGDAFHNCNDEIKDNFLWALGDKLREAELAREALCAEREQSQSLARLAFQTDASAALRQLVHEYKDPAAAGGVSDDCVEKAERALQSLRLLEEAVRS